MGLTFLLGRGDGHRWVNEYVYSMPGGHNCCREKRRQLECLEREPPWEKKTKHEGVGGISRYILSGGGGFHKERVN